MLINPASIGALFGMNWDFYPAPALGNLVLPPDLFLDDAFLFEIMLPSDNPPIMNKGSFTFAIAATKQGSLQFISNIAVLDFLFE